MKLISTLTPATDGGPQAMAFDTVVDGRTVFVAIAVSTDGGLQVTPAGQRSIDLMSAQASSHTGQVHMVPISTVGTAGQNVRRVLKVAKHGDCVVYLGRDDACCAEAMKALNVISGPAAGAH